MCSTGLIPNIIMEIASAENVDPMDLPTFHDVIDSEALGALVATEALHDPDLEITFTYYDYRISVQPPDEISIVPVDGDI